MDSSVLYCPNIQYLSGLNAMFFEEVEKFTIVYCDVNDCGSCPFHSNKVSIKKAVA